MIEFLSKIRNNANSFYLSFKNYRKIVHLEIFDEKEFVANRFTGEIVELEPEAVAMYDLTMGAERFGMYKTMRTCLDWFIDNYPKEYMVLLD